MLSRAVGLLLVLAVSAPVAIGAQDSLALRERALVSAVLFVRGSAAEDLRTVPADSIVIDGSTVLERPAVSPEVLAELGRTLRAVVVWSHNACGQDLSPNRALFARGQCAVTRWKYYVEAEVVAIDNDSAAIIVHVFRRPTGIQRVDYSGYRIDLIRTRSGWSAPRLLWIRET